jgi:hypothetical protein
MDTEKTALTVAAAMAAVIIEPEKRSRMTISFCVAVLQDVTAMKISPMIPNLPATWAWRLYFGFVCGAD